MRALVDNDILFKGACYGLLGELILTVCADGEVIGVLGAAPFVVRKIIEKSALVANPERASAALMSFLAQTETLEPTDDEQQIAADLEVSAQKLRVSLDAGESQLCAIIVQRLVPLLLTGDKRAVAAVEKLIDTDPRLLTICGKILCLEQLIAKLLASSDHGRIRTAICSEPNADKTLAICFSCTAASMHESSFTEGLQSYIDSIRKDAIRVLAA